MRIHTPRDITLRMIEDVSTYAERLEYMRQRFSARKVRPCPRLCFPPEPLFDSFRDREATVRLIREEVPHSIDETIIRADGLLNNRIPIFSQICDFGSSIDWHLERVSGARAPSRFYRDIDFLDAGSVGDKKYIWELNRHNYFLSLGKAYWFTGDRAYYDKWKQLVLSWIAANPYNVGINWASSLELAIRAINWIWSSYFFRDELGEDRELLSEFCEILRLHAEHVERHLSYVFSPNTHLTGEALGLLYIGKSFPFMERAPRWIAVANRILESELEKQIRPDGGYFEMATYYHKYSIDFYLHYLLLNGGPEAIDGDRVSRIRRMIMHLLLIAEPDGTIPLLGDSDGGQLLFFNNTKNNIRGSCCAAAALLNDGAIKHFCGPAVSEELIWFLGPAGAARYRALPDIPPPSYHSLNHETGIYCFRTGIGAHDSSFLIDCGPHGWKACGHAHADLLSFEWISHGVKVIVDPGTNTYTGSTLLRNRSRMSQSHNTISINDISQSVPGAVFRWKTIAHPKHAYARTLEDIAFFEGEHDAYDRYGCHHKRSVLFFGRELILIIDILKLERETSSFLLNMQCNAGDLLRLSDTLFRFVHGPSGSRHYIRIFDSGGVRGSVVAGEIYPDYGSAVPAPRIELTGHGIRDSLIVITALCSDESLAGAMRYEPNGRFVAAGRGSTYALDIHSFDYSKKTGRVESALAAFAERGEGVVMCARRARSVRDAAGNVRYDGGRDHDMFIAVGREGTFTMEIDAPPREFVLSYPIRSLVINGAGRKFTQRDGLVTVSA